MKHPMAVILGPGLGLALLAAGLPAVAGPPQITVTGEGQVTAAPDMATLRLGVVERADTAEAALEAAARAATGLLAALAEAGVEDGDVRTSELSLQPLWRDDGPRTEETLRGFEAATAVTVRLYDLDGLGALLSAAVGAGAARFDGLSLGLSDPAEALDEARRRAVAEARRKATLYAEAAGTELGPVRSISEDGTQPPRPMSLRSASMDMAEAMPVATGEITVSASVTVIFGGPD